jgi:hypothetical protein
VSGVYVNVIVGIYANTLNRKSQLAVEYAYRLVECSLDVSVFWVHASSAAWFEEGYRRIAERAGWDRPDSDIIPAVHNWLCDKANGRWLMIVDNADDATIFSAQLSSKNIDDEDSTATRAKSFSQFLPQSQHGSILITSRSREVAFQITGDTRDIIPVGPMDEDHALILLRTELLTDFDEDDGKMLLQVLDYMPLAITQAAAFIDKTQVSISKYLHDLKKSDTERVRQDKVGPPITEFDYSDTHSHIREGTVADSGYCSGLRDKQSVVNGAMLATRAMSAATLSPIAQLPGATQVEPLPESSEVQRPTKESFDDSFDIYSDAGSLKSKEDEVTESFSEWLLAMIHQQLGEISSSDALAVLPEILQEFAVRLGHEGKTRNHRKLMYVAHKPAAYG